jgi:hypothetical protein
MQTLEAVPGACYFFLGPRAMPSKQFLLAALIAPGSVEAAVGKVQAALFSEHGLASAVALPPLIPVAFLDAASNGRGLLEELNASAAAGWRMRLSGTAWVDGHLYAGVQSHGAWASVRARALQLCGPETGCLFPAAEGFYLGCGDCPSGLRPQIEPVVPEMSFSSCTIALMGVRTDSMLSEWWRDVSWEVRHERPFRGRKEQ